MLSEDDVNLRDMSADELDAAWDLWFDLAQTTNDSDPPYTHGVFAHGRHAAGGPRTLDPENRRQSLPGRDTLRIP